MLGLEIKFPGPGKAIIGIEALLGNPEGMLKTDENGCIHSSKKQKNLKERVELIRPMKECKEGAYIIEYMN